MLYSLAMLMKERLKAARKAVGLTQPEAAHELHVSPQAVSQWERGESQPSRENLFGAAKLYRVPVETLRDSGIPLPPPEPDRLEEFLESLVDIGKAVPEAQREHVIKVLDTFIPKQPTPQKTRQRA